MHRDLPTMPSLATIGTVGSTQRRTGPSLKLCGKVSNPFYGLALLSFAGWVQKASRRPRSLANCPGRFALHSRGRSYCNRQRCRWFVTDRGTFFSLELKAVFSRSTTRSRFLDEGIVIYETTCWTNTKNLLKTRNRRATSVYNVPPVRIRADLARRFIRNWLPRSPEFVQK